MVYDNDPKAVSDVQRAVNAAGRQPTLKVTGAYDAATQAGVQWLWTQGSTGPFSGHIDDDLLNALGIDAARKGYAGTAAHVDVKAPPPPPPPAPPVGKIAAATTVAGAGVGFLLGGPLGAGIGAVGGAIAGVVLAHLA